MKCKQCREPMPVGWVYEGDMFCTDNCRRKGRKREKLRAYRRERNRKEREFYAGRPWHSPPTGFWRPARDLNEPLIIRFLEHNNVPYVLYDPRSDGFGTPNFLVPDMMVDDMHGGGHWVEIKNPKARWRLSGWQEKWHAYAQEMGKPVEIVTCIEEMTDLLLEWGYEVKHLDYEGEPDEWVFAKVADYECKLG